MVPLKGEEQENPCYISRRVCVPLNPVERQEQNQQSQDDDYDNLDHNEPINYLIACADIRSPVPRERHDEDDTGDDDADSQQNEEEGFVEAVAAAEVEIGDDTDQQESYTAYFDEFVKLCLAFFIVQFCGFDGHDDCSRELKETKEDVEGTRPALVYIDLHARSIPIYYQQQRQQNCQFNLDCHHLPILQLQAQQDEEMLIKMHLTVVTSILVTIA